MNLNHFLAPKVVAFSIAGFPSLAAAWHPGTYPTSPNGMHTHGFAVNKQDRNDVVAFWHAVYQASEGYASRIAWTGNYTGKSGTTSGAFADDVERRLNYFRAMCGVPSDAFVNSGSKVVIDPLDIFKASSATSKAQAAQDAALMLVRNFDAAAGRNPAITHNPPSNLVGWTAAGWNAAAKGNLAFGVCGPAAITEYMVEELTSTATVSTWNSLVGHRRWSLYPAATDFGSGDQPGTSASRPPTNIFYVLQNPGELRPQPAVGFVPYPAAGFFPAPLNSRFWSVSRAGANFNSANVKVTDSRGNAVPVAGIKRSAEFGDPAIVWEVGGSAAAKSVAADTTFNVLISGISGAGIPATYSYSVTLIDPNRITSTQKIQGLTSLAVGKSGTYKFTPPAGAEAFQVVSYRKSSVSWTEDAEVASKAKIIDHTSESYPLLVKTKTFAGFGNVVGATAFRLTFPTSYDVVERGVPDQIFEIDREIVAKAKAKISFDFRRGFMTRDTVLAVESSSDGGITWKSLGSPIKGVSDTKYDTKLLSASYPLPKSKAPVRVRFRLYAAGPAIYTHEAAPKLPTGIFIDEITTKGCDWYEPLKANALSAHATALVLKKQTAGAKLAKGSEWQLRLRVRLGGKWFPPGPPTSVKIK